MYEFSQVISWGQSRMSLGYDIGFYSYENSLDSIIKCRPVLYAGSRVAFNTISSFLDANFLHVSTKEVAKSLRLGKQGLLKYLNMFAEHGLKPLLPLKATDLDDG